MTRKQSTRQDRPPISHYRSRESPEGRTESSSQQRHHSIFQPSNGYMSIPTSLNIPHHDKSAPMRGHAVESSLVINADDYRNGLPRDSQLIDVGIDNTQTSPYLSDVETTETASLLIEQDVCFPAVEEERGEINYAAMDEYVIQERRELQKTQLPRRAHRRRLSNMLMPDGARQGRAYYGEPNYPATDDLDVYRITYYSPFKASSIHARTLCEIPAAGEKLSEMAKKGCFWIDILDPTDEEMKALGKIFNIHPLTIEDIAMDEPREKCEVFKNYCFITFRAFDPNPSAITPLKPLGMHILVFKECVLTFHLRPMNHPQNVRKRIKLLKDYIHVTPDWICYGILDDITDSFAPLIYAVEFEVDSIDELVLILKESEQSDMLRRIGYCRKKMMGLLRLLVTKADVLKTMIKRGEAWMAVGTEKSNGDSDVAIYLGDVQDHLITMLQSLNHYEKISSRSHSNYLAQISIEMTQTNNEINDVLSKLTALGSIIIPMNLVTGLWGMNVQVPGQAQEDLWWFSLIFGSILSFCVFAIILMRCYRII